MRRRRDEDEASMTNTQGESMKKLISILFATVLFSFAGQARAADAVPHFGFIAPT